ncbi:hypothetical protein E4U43_004552 [Claviceps pusilla]|uniref:Uncharacterized protein n=1 Tax=Claviceps pusilla TaxID=123648 RepID=A0A9P7N5Z3_9HYPO|nr:hypothetical protein E4U43_004552 [Claviceps pusilla]
MMSPQILDPDLIVRSAEIETVDHRLDLNRAERTFSKGGGFASPQQTATGGDICPVREMACGVHFVAPETAEERRQSTRLVPLLSVLKLGWTFLTFLTRKHIVHLYQTHSGIGTKIEDVRMPRIHGAMSEHILEPGLIMAFCNSRHPQLR